MTQRTLYRLETADGTGAFQAVDIGRFGSIMVGLGYDGIDHPGPFNDGPIIEDAFERLVGVRSRWGTDFHDGHEAWVCGCKDALQAAFWFPRETIGLLTAAAVDLTLWSAPATEAFDGNHQVLFNRAHSTLVERRPAASLYR